MSATVVKLQSEIQHYAWGSHRAIATLQGRKTPSTEPEAELWIGDHPRAPSRAVVDDGTSIPLPDWIEGQREHVLGKADDHLPFLVKILAAARSLSVQVHPDAEKARAGWARENAAGVPASERSYPDPYAKHEILIALSRFEALCGLRDDSAVRHAARAVPALGRLAPVAPEAPSPSLALATLVALGTLAGGARESMLDELDAFARGTSSREAALVARLRSEHPGDPLAAAPLLLHDVVLEPGEAVVVEPGTVHTYLRGTGVEVMTRSDNVVRAGLTPKHVDREELLVITRPQLCAPRIQRPAPGRDGVVEYAPGTDAFRVRALELHESPVARPGGRVTALVCVEGAASVEAGDRSFALRAGEAALVPACCEGFQLRSTGEAPGRTGRVFEVSSR